MSRINCSEWVLTCPETQEKFTPEELGVSHAEYNAGIRKSLRKPADAMSVVVNGRTVFAG